MIINVDDIHSALVRQIKLQVGDQLSTFKDKPSVIKDIQGGIRPDFPFITIALKNDHDETQGQILGKFLDENDDMFIYTEQIYMFTISCWGPKGPTKILNDLRIFNTDEGTRFDMDADTGCKFQGYSDINRDPKYLNTEFVNAASMDITLACLSLWNSASGQVIEQVVTEETYFDGEGDPQTLVINQTYGTLT